MLQKTVQSSFLILLITICLFASISSFAKDITNEQRNAYQARKEYNQSKADYENLLERITQQEKRVSTEQAKLNKMKAEEAAAKTKLENAKMNLDAKVKALNEAWQLRDK